MPVEVHGQYLKRRYVAPVCSLACGLNFAIIVGAAILPLYMGWASHGFWLKEVTRWEQPDVTYKSQCVVILSGNKGTSATGIRPFQLVWTTSPNVNDHLGSTVRGPIVKSSTADLNLDGKADRLDMVVSMPLASDEVIHAATLIAFADVQLHSVTRMRMDVLLMVQHDSAMGGSMLAVDGDMSLMQRDAVPFTVGGVYTPYRLSPLPDLNTALGAEVASPVQLMAQYRSRNHTAYVNAPSPLWVPEIGYVPVVPGSTSDVSTVSAIPRTFDVRATIRFPPTSVRVRPGVSEEIKHGWIQYIAFLPITVAVALILRHIFFAYHLVETSVYVDAPRAKLHVE